MERKRRCRVQQRSAVRADGLPKCGRRRMAIQTGPSRDQWGVGGEKVKRLRVRCNETVDKRPGRRAQTVSNDLNDRRSGRIQLQHSSLFARVSVVTLSLLVMEKAPHCARRHHGRRSNSVGPIRVRGEVDDVGLDGRGKILQKTRRGYSYWRFADLGPSSSRRITKLARRWWAGRRRRRDEVDLGRHAHMANSKRIFPQMAISMGSAKSPATQAWHSSTAAEGMVPLW